MQEYQKISLIVTIITDAMNNYLFSIIQSMMYSYIFQFLLKLVKNRYWALK